MRAATPIASDDFLGLRGQRGVVDGHSHSNDRTSDPTLGVSARPVGIQEEDQIDALLTGIDVRRREGPVSQRTRSLSRPNSSDNSRVPAPTVVPRPSSQQPPGQPTGPGGAALGDEQNPVTVVHDGQGADRESRERRR